MSDSSRDNPLDLDSRMRMVSVEVSLREFHELKSEVRVLGPKIDALLDIKQSFESLETRVSLLETDKAVASGRTGVWKLLGGHLWELLLVLIAMGVWFPNLKTFSHP